MKTTKSAIDEKKNSITPENGFIKKDSCALGYVDVTESNRK